MFSLDLLLVAYGKVAWTFILANKFTILAVFYSLDKFAKTTETTVDDSILTFLKNLFLTCVGKGDQVKAVYNELKEIGLVHEKLDGKTLKHYQKKLGTPKQQNLEFKDTDMNKYPVNKGRDPERLDEIDDGPTVPK